jgi:tetratricopeptide (TPR) repeat protein
MKYFFSIFLIFLIACGNEEPASPYAELLQNPPYAAISDSIKKEPENSELYFRRAVMLNNNQQTLPALADFSKAWSLDKQERYALGIGNIWLMNNPDSAAAFVEQALNVLPESPFLPLLLARAYEGAGKMDRAIEVCDSILGADPNQVNALVLKAEILQEKNDRAGAVIALEKAYALLPENRQLAEELAYEYAETQNAKVLPLTDSLIRVDTLRQFASPFYIKGNYYANIRNNSEAIRWYDAAIQRDHRYLNAYIEKGKIFFRGNQFEKALGVFQLANTIAPGFPDAWYWIARCQEEMGQKAEAKLNYQKAYSLDQSFLQAKEAADSL